SLFTLCLGATVVGVALGGASLAVRFRSARGEQRQQLRWVASLAVIVPLGMVPISLLVTGMIGGSSVALHGLIGLVLVTVPLIIGLSVLRYRLYDIDLVISRAVVFAILAGFITIAYLALVVGVGTLVGSGGRSNVFLSVIATAVVALAFQPVRSR